MYITAPWALVVGCDHEAVTLQFCVDSCGAISSATRFLDFWFIWIKYGHQHFPNWKSVMISSQNAEISDIYKLYETLKENKTAEKHLSISCIASL
jgi:hypothetical protein